MLVRKDLELFCLIGCFLMIWLEQLQGGFSLQLKSFSDNQGRWLQVQWLEVAGGEEMGREGGAGDRE